jgi:ABC-type phosphate/phosphonate transport system ATPase subunit
MNHDDKVTYFAETDARSKRTPFGIKSSDRSRHTYVIGKTGMGKSTMLENMAIQDIRNGEGMAFIDPHGKTADFCSTIFRRNASKMCCILRHSILITRSPSMSWKMSV